jgi:hypothetical protein
MQLPENDGLEISKLSSVFSDTTNSYKFYWFLSILDSLQENNEAIISLNDIALRMVANVWYPLDYFKLSFGKQDGFKKIAEFLTSKITIDNSINSLSLFNQINSKLNLDDNYLLSLKTLELLRWVPFRFLRPYFSKETKGLPDHQVNGKITELANNNFKNNPQKVIYRFVGDCIELNAVWIDYFQKHQGILRGFIYWHLIKFLQKNNPNVIGLSEKLNKPTHRNLKQANLFWKEYLKETPQVKCIYSGQEITLQNLSLDHFLPWSFVAHDQLWNIIPTPKNVNSAKSDCLPSIELYINDYVYTQFKVFEFYFKKDKSKIMEDYSILFSQSSEFDKLIAFEDFKENLKKHILPQIQTARNMGFSYPFIYRK